MSFQSKTVVDILLLKGLNINNFCHGVQVLAKERRFQIYLQDQSKMLSFSLLSRVYHFTSFSNHQAWRKKKH